MEAPNAQGITLHTAGRSRTAEICYLQLESHINSFVYQMYSGHMIGKKVHRSGCFVIHIVFML